MSVPALARGLRIIEFVARASRPTSFSDIANELKLANASVSRLLNELMRSGYLQRDELSHGYRPGARLLEVVADASSVERLRRCAAEVLEAVVRDVANTSVIVHWNGSEMRCIAKRTHSASIPMHPVGHVSRRLERRPWGWAFLATLGRGAQRRRLEALDADLREKVIQEMRAYRDVGYAVDLELLQPMVRRLAAPIFDSQGRVVACLAVGGNPLTMPDAQVAQTGQTVIRHAQRLSEMLAHPKARREEAA